MNFTPDIIFKHFGQFDKVVVVTFKENSKSFSNFGTDLTGIFYYTKAERDKLKDHLNSETQLLSHNFVKFDVLLKCEQPKEKQELIKSTGIPTEDIVGIFTLNQKDVNKFEIDGIKELEFDVIKVDFNLDSPLIFFIDYYQKRIRDGETLLESEKCKYAAIKWIVDENPTPEFYKEYIIDIETVMPKLNVLLHKMQFELELGISKPEEHKEIFNSFMNKIKSVVENQLNDLGITKEDYHNPKKLLWLFLSLLEIGSIFEDEIYLYSNPKIYLDFQGLLHIFLRHTNVFTVNSLHINRSKFSYQLKDLKDLLKIIIQKNSEEIENHYAIKGNQQFRTKSIYYEGDYYTLSISKDGRIESFHPN